jgi:hypothetical protein
METDPEPASSLHLQVRATVADAASANGVLLGPAEDDWIVRGVPLAPFPARLRLDSEQQLLWHDVVVAEVVPPVAVEAVVEGIELPRPEVRLLVGEARWMVALSYPLPLARVTESEVVGLLAAGALYATALAVELTGHLGKRWRELLEGSGFRPGEGFAHDPRDLLRAGVVVAWPEIGQ